MSTTAAFYAWSRPGRTAQHPGAERRLLEAVDELHRRPADLDHHLAAVAARSAPTRRLGAGTRFPVGPALLGAAWHPHPVDDPPPYRDIIDRLVRSCREGQGQIGPRRARAGVWNASADASPDEMPDQRAINLLLARLDPSDRVVIAAMLRDAFVEGVHETLVVLHETGVQPFVDGCEGTPFHDFVGRLDGWEWPMT